MFVANTKEDGTVYPNRLRWSHETLPKIGSTDLLILMVVVMV
jgi:hypothetical protein